MELKFGFNHYVPVLRWKPAEVGALSELAAPTWDHMTPLLELCPPMFIRKEGIKRKKSAPKTPEDILSSRLEELSRAVKTNPIFIDLRHLLESETSPDNQLVWDIITSKGTALGMQVIPVTGFYGKGEPYQAKISQVAHAFGNGAAIRLFRNNIENGSHLNSLARLTEMVNVDVEEIDLVIDLELIGANPFPIRPLISRIPRLNDWRTLTVVAGSFPRDLGYPMKANDTYILPRYELKRWHNELNRLTRLESDRMPSFGDYTIQHALYKEPVKHPHVSASIRYATPDDWIVLRGEYIGKKDGLGSAQYPAEAKLLMEKPEYSGERFSFGDRFIAEKARNGSAHPGGIAQWLLAGINHHMTLTAEMVRLQPRSTEETGVVVPVR